MSSQPTARPPLISQIVVCERACYVIPSNVTLRSNVCVTPLLRNEIRQG
jgi:hypothetical protein